MELLTWMQEQDLPWTDPQREVIAQAQNELDTLREQLRQLEEQGQARERADALQQAIAAQLQRRGVRRTGVVQALLDLDAISLEGEQPVGLCEQLDAMSRDPETAFLFEEPPQLPEFLPMGGRGWGAREKAARRIMGLIPSGRG